VTEAQTCDIDRFIPLLQERVYVVNPNCRQFLIAWLVVLDSVPDIELIHYLPRFLDGLFNMLKDSSKEIRLETESCLAEFLREIRVVTEKVSELPENKKKIDFAGLVKILFVHCNSKGMILRNALLINR
jgi:hypothetical protein